MIAGIYLWNAGVNQRRIKILLLSINFNFICWCKGNYLIGEQGQGSNEDMKTRNTSLTCCIKHKYKNNKYNYSSFPFSSPSSVLSSSNSSFSFFLLVVFYSYTPPVLFGTLRFKREIKLSHTHTSKVQARFWFITAVNTKRYDAVYFGRQVSTKVSKKSADSISYPKVGNKQSPVKFCS